MTAHTSESPNCKDMCTLPCSLQIRAAGTNWFVFAADAPARYTTLGLCRLREILADYSSGCTAADSDGSPAQPGLTSEQSVYLTVAKMARDSFIFPTAIGGRPGL